jgi:AcrR family transcriptional regulator
MEMPEKVKTRRKYYSPLRADQAEQTRRRILEAGFRLFVDRGYAGTTIAAVAEEAGVSPETIYLSLDSKRGLLEGAIETAIAGHDDPPTAENEWWAMVAELPGARDRLEKMVEFRLCGTCVVAVAPTVATQPAFLSSGSASH